MSVYHVYEVPMEARRGFWIPMDLELRMVVNSHVGAGNWTWVTWPRSALMGWAFSLAPTILHPETRSHGEPGVHQLTRHSPVSVSPSPPYPPHWDYRLSLQCLLLWVCWGFELCSLAWVRNTLPWWSIFPALKFYLTLGMRLALPLTCFKRHAKGSTYFSKMLSTWHGAPCL